MSHQKLTIVVTCTDRKTVRPGPQLTARTLPSGTVRHRLDTWKSRLLLPVTKRPLLDLYQGETWGQVRLLIATAEQAGFIPDVFVASAGLGLRHAHTEAGAYSATFTLNNEDSVSRSLSESREWWRGLDHEHPPSGQPCLMVLPQTYARVIAPWWPWEDMGDTVVFGGSGDVPEAHRIPADRSLRGELGGTATSINVRMAIQWLKVATEYGFATEETRKAWDAWRLPRQRVESFNRTPVTDHEVRSFVTALRVQLTGLTKTRALRMLRDSGMACEQRRFSELFEEVTR